MGGSVWTYFFNNLRLWGEEQFHLSWGVSAVLGEECGSLEVPSKGRKEAAAHPKSSRRIQNLDPFLLGTQPHFFSGSIRHSSILD